MLPSRQELMTMPITLLEHQNIESPEEEKIVQDILNQRRSTMPSQRQVYDLDAKGANIQTPQEEAEWQKKLDERRAKLRPQAQVETIKDEPQPEKVEEPKVEEPQAKARFCEFCDSKGVRHKLNCTRPK